MWLTSISGISKAKAIALANDVPTNKDPKSPGPRVKAMAFSSFLLYSHRVKTYQPPERYVVGELGMPIQAQRHRKVHE